jgi:hypothetical protein
MKKRAGISAVEQNVHIANDQQLKFIFKNQYHNKILDL